VAVTVVAVAGFAVPLGFAASRLYRSREVSRLAREATRAVGALPVTGLHGVEPIHMPSTSARVHLALYDDTGTLVAGDGPLHGDNEVRAALRGQVSDDHDGAWLAVAVPLHDEQKVVGAARAATSWSVVAHDTVRSWFLMGGLGGLAVAMAAALAWWQSNRLVKPVDEVAAMAVRLGDGDFSGHVSASGVSELDRAAESLNRTASRLGDIVSRERAFTADVSHQLNTPLTSLRLALESALLTPGADERAALESAVDEVDRLQGTVATLLAVARDGRASADGHCDVRAVCDDVATRIGPDLAARGRPLRVALDDGLPVVRCPADVVREILAVVVENALRHGSGTVALSARAAGPGVVLEVSDEGSAVLDEATVFERRSPSANGYGIGLALARSLAEAHDARLTLAQPGPHPVFTLALATSREP
jgi:signal transduction histidine kinase